MSQELWTSVDHYLCESLVPTDSALEDALRRSDEGGLPAIAVTPNLGKLLQMLVTIHGSKRILEIGTLGGYSTIWIARALPGEGHLITLEFDPHHAEVAGKNIEAAGLSHIVEIKVGPALDSLPHLSGSFDFVFIDADKLNNPHYFEWALKLTRPGSLILVDNTVRGGAVIESTSEDPNIQGVRKLHELISKEPRVTATAIQTVGSKGYDGFTLIRVL